jgi:hypothetical protein
MAIAEVNVSVEKIVHDAFAHAAKLALDHGVQIESVSFEWWRDLSPKPSLLAVRIDSTTYAPWGKA